MRESKLIMRLIASLLIVFCFGLQSLAVRLSQPRNLVVGLRYGILSRGIASGFTPLSQEMITGTEVIDGYEVLLLSRVTSEGEVMKTKAILRTEGSKVYQWVEEGWYLIYDFGIQPGEEIEGYYTIPNLGKVRYRCLSVQENPIYDNLKTIQLQVKYPGDDRFSGNEEWIIGIGSIDGLLTPTHNHMVGSGGPFLEWVSLGEEFFFNLYTLSVEDFSSDKSDYNEIILDLHGHRVPPSCIESRPGIYIGISDCGIGRKIIIH